jgi:DNA (cytosine-5)-methyltransferase 1
VIVANNLTNSRWDGFAESSQRDPSVFRTPSPCTKDQGYHNYSTGTIGLSSQEHQRKRIRDGSLSIGSKRSRYFSPGITDCGLDELDIEIRGEDAQYDIYRESPSPRGRQPTEDELDHGVIVLDADDDLGDLIETSSRNWHSHLKKGSRSLDPEYVLIDLDDEEDRLFEEVRMLAPRESPPPGRSETVIELRNLPITPPWVVQESEQTDMGILEPGDVVELKGSGFLRISIILKNLQSDAVKLRGWRLERSRELNGILPKKLNELYWNMEIELDDPRPPMVQGMEEIDLAQVLGMRKLQITNKLFPSCSFRETGGFYNEKDVFRKGPCTVRWRYSCKYLTARDRWHNKWNERCVEHLKEGDFLQDDRLALFASDTKVRSRYRGDTILGGAYGGLEKSDSTKPSVSATVHKNPDKQTVLIIDDEPEVERMWQSVSEIELSDKGEKKCSSHLERLDVPNRRLQQRRVSSPREVIDLSDYGLETPPKEGFIKTSKARSSGLTARKQSIRSQGQKYTYGDSCKLYLLHPHKLALIALVCGAGGATRGALMAGLKPIWGFDANKHACSSWRLNFPDATLYEEWADQFIQRGLGNYCLRVDILHLSPPCQYFSPAHTVEGKDDEMNMASLFACGTLLDVAKPRIATLEQTFGSVLLPRFQAYFNALILMFTDRGFSIRWKIAQLQNWVCLCPSRR